MYREGDFGAVGSRWFRVFECRALTRVLTPNVTEMKLRFDRFETPSSRLEARVACTENLCPNSASLRSSPSTLLACRLAVPGRSGGFALRTCVARANYRGSASPVGALHEHLRELVAQHGHGRPARWHTHFEWRELAGLYYVSPSTGSGRTELVGSERTGICATPQTPPTASSASPAPVLPCSPAGRTSAQSRPPPSSARACSA